MKRYKKYDYKQCALYKCRNKRRLEELLRLEKYDLNKLDSLDSLIKYRMFEIDKKGGLEKRLITAPCKPLKKVQKRILRLLQPLNRPEWLISGERDKSYISNGKIHTGNTYMLTVDIRKYYDHCRREYVFRFFTDYLRTSKDIAGVLTDLVTYKRKVPTGSPISQIVSYYAYREMFREIYEAAERYGCTFTLYVDDMTFSSRSFFCSEKLFNEVDIILRKYGHKPDYKKRKTYSSKQSKLVTGTIITPTNQLLAPDALKKNIMNTFEEMKEILMIDGRTFSKKEVKKLKRMKGQLIALRNIEESQFSEIKRLVNQAIDQLELL